MWFNWVSECWASDEYKTNYKMCEWRCEPQKNQAESDGRLTRRHHRRWSSPFHSESRNGSAFIGRLVGKGLRMDGCWIMYEWFNDSGKMWMRLLLLTYLYLLTTPTAHTANCNHTDDIRTYLLDFVRVLCICLWFRIFIVWFVWCCLPICLAVRGFLDYFLHYAWCMYYVR